MQTLFLPRETCWIQSCSTVALYIYLSPLDKHKYDWRYQHLVSAQFQSSSINICLKWHTYSAQSPQCTDATANQICPDTIAREATDGFKLTSPCAQSFFGQVWNIAKLQEQSLDPILRCSLFTARDSHLLLHSASLLRVHLPGLHLQPLSILTCWYFPFHLFASLPSLLLFSASVPINQSGCGVFLWFLFTCILWKSLFLPSLSRSLV